VIGSLTVNVSALERSVPPALTVVPADTLPNAFAESISNVPPLTVVTLV
jgi:hypothetical protein